ncbi:FAD:protein FMN transferase [hydrothermal vent metagenome]|uniref:FAD:protein FMN transferase n=1 Tax=hydrothermal vent metagenome TaxID=652676 RepID=A0A3B0WBQ9_9ZZZZ
MRMIVNCILDIKSFILLSVLFLVACQHQAATVSKHQLFVFGTLVEINIWHHDAKQTQQAVDEISATFNVMHHQWHAWKPGRLSTINQALRANQSVLVTTEEAEFIKQTITQAKLSDHMFNPVIGELIHLWGFHTDDYPLLTPPPSKTEIKRLVEQQLTVDDLWFDGLQLSSHNPSVWLDFGGIAKGYAVDRAIRILAKHNITNAIVNAGGDLRSIGSKGGTPWRVAIQSPSDWSLVAELLIDGDEAVFTSGNYQRYKEFDGQRYAHIIDPSTGLPVSEVVSATVITKIGVDADAAATALVVAGSENWLEIAQQMGIDQALIINDQQQCLGTSAMIKRLENLSITCQILN